MNAIRIRLANPNHVWALETVENRCFSSVRRATRRALRESLRSPSQHVWIAWSPSETKNDRTGTPAGALTLHVRRHSVRIYSLAVLPAFRGMGLGRRLMGTAIRQARLLDCRYLSLEADRRDRRLLDWYRQWGFEVVAVLRDYYAAGRDGVRMRRPLPTRQSLPKEHPP